MENIDNNPLKEYLRSDRYIYILAPNKKYTFDYLREYKTFDYIDYYLIAQK